MPEPTGLPAWADEMREMFRAGAASQFVLHGNVFDLVAAPGPDGRCEWVSLTDFLSGTMFQPFDVVIRYDRGRGVSIEPPRALRRPPPRASRPRIRTAACARCRRS